jgi:lysozyme
MPPYLPLALGLIKQWEGYKAEPYQDSTGTWTIGYGQTEGVCRTTPPIDQAQADAYLTKKLTQLDQILPSECFVPLTDHQRAALLSLAWNMGIHGLGRSTLMEKLNNGAYQEAANHITDFTYSKGIWIKGLERRRLAEKAFFLTPDV